MSLSFFLFTPFHTLGTLRHPDTQAIMALSVQSTTRSSYSTGIKRWTSFLQAHSCDPLLFVDLPQSTQIDTLLAFLLHVGDEQALAVSTLDTILSAIAYFYRKQGHPNLISSLNGTTRLFLAGLAPSARERRRTAEKSKRAAITPDMLQKMYTHWWKDIKQSTDHNDIDRRMACIACVTAFTCMLRCSEYIPKKIGDRALKGEDVTLIHNDGRLLGLELGTRAGFLEKSQRHHLRSIRLTLVSSKTDQSGKGHPFFIDREGKLTKSLFNMLLDWCQTARIGKEQYLFSRPKVAGSGHKLLTTRLVTEGLRWSAQRCGWPEDELHRITTHSLRAGGATFMDAKGFSREDILKAGRWNNRGMHDLQYRVATRAYPNALSTRTEHTDARRVRADQMAEALAAPKQSLGRISVGAKGAAKKYR